MDRTPAALRLIDLAGCADRDGARGRVYAAARAALAEAAGIAADHAAVRRRPGLPPQVDPPGWSLSLSYAGRWALAAFARGAVGVDLMRVEDFAELPEVARLYLDPGAADAVLSAPAAQRPLCFAEAWAAMEAAAKCSGLGVAERPAASACRVMAVDAPDGWVARLAVPAE